MYRHLFYKSLQEKREVAEYNIGVRAKYRIGQWLPEGSPRENKKKGRNMSTETQVEMATAATIESVLSGLTFKRAQEWPGMTYAYGIDVRYENGDLQEVYYFHSLKDARAAWLAIYDAMIAAKVSYCHLSANQYEGKADIE